MAYRDGSKVSGVQRLDPPPPPLVLNEQDGSSATAKAVLSQPQMIATFPSRLMILPQLVDCDDQILVVGSTDLSRSRLVVIRLADILLHRQRPTTVVSLTTSDIGDHCLFFGMRSLAVSSKGGLPSIPRNTVILCDSIPGHLQQYNLADGTLSPACDGDIVRTPPPSPHSIVHHLVTCCYRYFWNKGLIYCTRTKPTWTTKNNKHLRFGA
ncbi:hypothetical protein PR202_gb12450 [Eleusine coracana subsp. coracana]|uniref:Uncharacterized protein n=1 Tax=Eleusine coracana subsp. coracana TaxID=191504 RepID=A0AAV5EPX4_ELECO|nr:hypothetical protein PR202_gb12450 [Eleusine coracana subsp. coracana]